MVSKLHDVRVRVSRGPPCAAHIGDSTHQATACRATKNILTRAGVPCFLAQPVGPHGKIHTNFAPPRKNYHEPSLAMRARAKRAPHSQAVPTVNFAWGRELFLFLPWVSAWIGQISTQHTHGTICLSLLFWVTLDAQARQFLKHTYKHTRTQTSKHTHTQTRTYAHTHIRTYAHTHIRTYAYAHTHAYNL